jgi:formiminotetrahydrofolate cyclodeaminase
MLLEALPCNIEINIQGVDYKTVTKEFEKEVKDLNKKIEQETKEMAYDSQTDAKDSMAKFAILTEPGRIKIEKLAK